MTPWVTRLIAANVALFVASALVQPIYYLFALIPAAVLVRPWTLITYMFLHAGIMHLLFNMIGLFFFGPRLEARLGGRIFLVLYFLSGLVGALLTFVLAPGAAVVGASGAVLGVLAGFARYWPDEAIYIWGVLPIRARTMVIALAVISIVSGFTGASGGVAHFAHLGGLAGGWFFLAARDRRRELKRNPRPRAPAAADRRRWESIALDALHPVNREEAERVLDKLRANGASSLSPREREFLDRMAPP